MANVTGDTAKTVSDQLTAIWNNFADGSKPLERYIDIITALGAATASSTTEIAEGLEKFAAIADTVGLSYEYATSALATVVARTRQSADIVGTSFKTLFARIQDLELGNTLDDGTTLGQYSQALATIGINIKDSNGQLKEMDDILNQMGKKWQTIDKATQVAVAQTVGGTRQYNQLLALMDSWDYMQENLQVAAQSDGTLERQAEIYAESWEAARNRVKAAAEEIYSALLNDDFFIAITNGFGGFLNTLNEVIKGLGGLKTLIIAIGGLLAKSFIAKIPNIQNTISAGITGYKQQVTHNLFGTTNVKTNQDKMLANQVNITEEDYKAKQNSSYSTEVDKTQAFSNAGMARMAQKSADINENWTGEERKRNEQQLEYYKVVSQTAIKQAEIVESTKKIAANTRDAATAELADRRIKEAKAESPDGTISPQKRTAINRSSEDYINDIQDIEKQQTQRKLVSSRHEYQMEDFKGTYEAIQKMPTGTKKDLREKAQAEAKLRSDINHYYDSIDRNNAELQNANGRTDYARFTRARRANPNMSTEELLSGGQSKTFLNPLLSAEYKSSRDGKAIRVKGQRVKGVTDYQEKRTDIDLTEEEAKNIDALTQATAKNQEATDRLNTSKEQLERTESGLDARLGQNKVNLGQLASSAVALATSISMVTGMIQTLGDENATAGQKIMSVVTTLGIVIGMLPTLSGGLSALGLKVTAFGIQGAVAGHTVKLAWWEVALIVLAITAAVGALILVFKAISNEYNKDANNAAKATKAAESLADAYDKVKESYEEMKQAISDYKDAEDALDKLTKGTEEYEKALKAANKQAQALVVKYKLLKGEDYSVTEDGRIIIKDTVLKQIEDKQEAELNQAEAVSNAANNAAAAANNKSKTTNLMREVAGDKAKSGWLWGGIGGTLAAASLFIPVVGPLVSGLIGAIATIGGGAAQAKIEAREAGMQAVIDKIAEGKLDVSGNLSYEEFKDLLKNANLNVDDDKLVKALYETRDSITDLAETERQIKQTEEQNAYTFARDLFAQNDAIVAAGLTNDLATMGKRIILQAEEKAEKGFDTAYENNGEELTRQFIKANAAALGKDVKYESKGKYTYIDEEGNPQTGTIDETELKYFYKVNQGQKSITQNQDEILKTYNSIANDPYFKAMVVDGNFNSLTRDQWVEHSRDDRITPEMFGLGGKSKDELDAFAQTVLGAKSWNDWISTVDKARQDTAKAWNSFKGHAVETIIDGNKNVTLETAQSFKNILDQFAKAPQYEENVALITNGINQLANGSTEALEALSALDYTSPEIGNQIRNTLINLGEPIALTDDAFSDLIDTIQSVSLAVPSYQTLYTTLNKINNIVKNLKFGSIIKEEEYDQLIKYNAALAQFFQKVGDDQYRFNSASVKEAKKASSDMARAQLDAARASAEAGRALINNGYIPEVGMESGMRGQDRQDYITQLKKRWKESGVFDLDVVKAKGITEDYFTDKTTDEQIQAAIKYINELAAAGMDDTALREAREVFASTIDNVNDLNDALDTGAITEKEYDKQLQYIINHAKEALSVVEAINEALDYQNKLLDRQSTIADTLYGGARLAALEEERKILAETIKLTEKKIQQLEIEAGLQAGALARKGVTFDASGRPENLDELYWKGIITEEERNNYLEVFNEFLEAQDELLQAKIKRQELYYQKLTEALKNQLDLIEMDRTKLEYDYKKIEDDVYKAAEGFGLLRKQQDLTLDSLELYKDQIGILQEAYAAGEITQADYVDGLKDIYNQIYDNLEAFDDLDEQMREYYTNTLAKMNEELDKYISKMKYLTELTDHYKSVITLISGENDYERLGLIYAAAGQTAQNNLSVALERQRAAKEQLEFLRSQPTALAEDIEAAEKQVQETTNEVFEAAQDALEITKDTALNNIKKVGAELEKTLTGGSTFERINQAMSMRSKYAELFYTQTNQVYETQKRINQVEQELAKTTNKAYSNELKLWKQRLESAQKQEKLSKNQLALMDAEFKLIQARAAFEDARNAKSEVRLSRDAEGNYGYVFTANADEVSKAEQEVLDAENALYNKQLEIANSNAEQIVQLRQEAFDKIKQLNEDLTLSEEEREIRIQEILNQYNPMILALTNDRNMAIAWNETNAATIVQEAWSSSFQSTIDNCSDWADAYNIYSQQCTEYLNQWYAVVDQITKQVGLDFDTLQAAMSGVTEESNALRDQLIGENGLIEALNQVALQVLQQTSAYAGLREQLLSVAEGYAQAAQKCRDFIAAAQEAASYQGGDYNQFNPITNVYWNADDQGNLNIYDADTGKLVGSNKISNTSSQLKEKMEGLKEKAQEEGLSDAERKKRAEEWKAARAEYNASLVSDAEKTINNNKYMNIIDDEAWDFDTAKKALSASSAEHREKAKEWDDKVQSTEQNTPTEKPSAAEINRKMKEKYGPQQFKQSDVTYKQNTNSPGLHLSEDEYKSLIKIDQWDNKFFPVYQDQESYWGGDEPLGYLPLQAFGLARVETSNGPSVTVYSPTGGGYKLWELLKSYDTGGYTGKWGPDGRLAMLHEKELVLNKDDTSNILAAVDLIRRLVDAIDLQQFGLLNVRAASVNANNSRSLKQSVEITAQFPNAVYHDEIKEAFDTLINRASQYANRNY